MTHNPSWPLMDYAFSLDSSPTTTSVHWLSATERTIDKATAKRGKAYETDQYQTGEAQLSIQNTDGAYDPGNTSGPFYPQVKLYRGYRHRAQFPATINLLTASQATAGTVTYDSSGNSTALAAAVLPTWVTGNYVPSTDGAGHYTNAVPGSPAANTRLIQVQGWSVTPGQTYSGGITVQSTASITLQVVWVTTFANGTQTSTGGTGATHAVTTSQRMTGSFTAPANAVGVEMCLFLVSGSSACTVTSSLYQVEFGASSSSYVQPNPWYPIFSGYVERWPQTWTRNGTYGRLDLTCVDIFGWLSQRPLHSAAYQEILQTSPGPAFLYCLDEPSVANPLFYDATGQQQPIGFASRGTSISTGFTATAGQPIKTLTTTPYGIPGSVAEIDAAASVSGSVIIPLLDTANTWPPTGSAWSRGWSCNPSAITAGANVIIWQLIQALPITAGLNLGNTYIQVGAGPASSGYAFLQVARAGSLLVNTFSATVVVTDGGWHRFLVTMSADGKTVSLWVDDVFSVSYTDASDMRFPPMNGADLLGTPAASNTTQYSCLTQWNRALSATEIANDYSTFLFGGSGKGTASSASRWTDILRWAQYAGLQSADNFSSGETVAYGPAVELAATRASSGVDVVSALQTVCDTENGTMYVARDGTVTLKARRARYNQNTPVVTFGENVAGGEIPYTAVAFTLDPTRLANDAQMTQTLTQAVARYVDTTGDLGSVQIQRDLNTLNSNELGDAAKFLVNRNKTPAQRSESITVPVSSFTNPAVSTAVWAAVLPLEIGARVRINRRPPAAPIITFDGFIESIAWTFDDNLNAEVTFEVSPATGLSFWEVGSSHTTVHTAVSIGGTSLVIDPLPDSATNPIQAVVSSAGNLYEWVVDWGTSKAEYVTVVKPTPNSAGYATATLQIGACFNLATGASGTGFQFAHSIGAVFQDIGGITQTSVWQGYASLPLLDSYINPAGALDTYSTLDSTTIVGY